MSRSQVEALLAESELTGDDALQLQAVLGPLAELAQDAPEPSAELRALFGEDTGARRRTGSGGRPRGRGTVAGAVVLALSGVGATGLSAAANSLPQPWQHEVSQFSRHYLPFDFPEPAARARGRGDAPEEGPVERSRRHADAGDASRDVAQAETTRALDRPRRAIKATSPPAGPRRVEPDDQRDGQATYSWPSSHADEQPPGHGRPAEVRGGDERPGREPGRGRGEDRRDPDRGDAAAHRDSGPSQDRGDDRGDDRGKECGSEEQGGQAPRSGNGGGDAGNDGGAGQDDGSPNSPEGPPAAPPGLTRVGEALGGALGQGDAPDA